MNIDNNKVIRISKKKLGILLIILVIIVVLIAVVLGSLGSARNGAFIMEDSATTSIYPDYYRGEPDDITDTREFIKNTYTGDVRTRDVVQVVDEAKLAVSEAGGRMDNYTVSPKRSDLQFVLPKSEFESFRAKMSNLTWAKLYIETVSAQNLLDQKQSIEERTVNNQATLTTLENRLTNLESNHQATLSSLNARLANYQTQLTEVRRQIGLTNNPEMLSYLSNQEISLSQNINRERASITAENQSYNSQKNVLSNQIQAVRNALQGLVEEDVDFINNIETVNGSMSIRWVSVWEVLKIYSPLHPLILIILILLIGRWILVRNGYLARIELV